ncbi:MerR family DNA-binding protein [Herpetosiphon llansteffanensis]|uniref:MerR family DNA-binding protein n=1 Tax=Herpetosiphon llansteffanensis TaxID=2094568 RepID=UPI000D7CE3BF|nr:MerR family DNA-binding protein [Herpetosiphon llansteffanensis]
MSIAPSSPLTIGVVAATLGIRTSAIRYYERIGLIPRPPLRSGQRRYAADIVPLLQLIHAAQQAGFTLTEIHTIVHGFDPATPPSARWAMLAAEKLTEIRTRMTHLQTMEQMLMQTLACSCSSMTACATDGFTLCAPHDDQ